MRAMNKLGTASKFIFICINIFELTLTQKFRQMGFG